MSGVDAGRGAVALFVHRAHADTAELARDAAAWLTGRGYDVRLSRPDAALTGLDHLGVDDDALTIGLELALSLGGDGTMLRTVDRVDGVVPVLGVNLGHLGYLTAVEPHDLHPALERWSAGDHEVEERMRLSIDVEMAGSGRSPFLPEGPARRLSALNEAVLGKSAAGQLTRLLVTVDGERFTTYAVDGLILATPTGSTAYAWSAGGPIVSPDHAALVLAPVAPHMLFDRALVLPPTTSVRIEVVDDRPALLAVDGQPVGELGRGDAIVGTASASPAKLVAFGRRSFLQILKAKFGLAES